MAHSVGSSAPTATIPTAAPPLRVPVDHRRTGRAAGRAQSLPVRSQNGSMVPTVPLCQLVVFCGLPGVGKTALSRRVADALDATFLRIDTIEAAVASTLAVLIDNPVGYAVASRVAADQLHAGRPVIADAVNSVVAARQGWVSLARDCAVPLRFVQVVCSDETEHRRRVETRTGEMPGHQVPPWQRVQDRPWEPLTEPHLIIDNVGDLSAHVSAVLDWLTQPTAERRGSP